MINNNLREYRTNYRLSQQEFAVLCGVSTRTIIRIEKGQVFPKFETMHKIAGVLGEDIVKIFPQDGLRITKKELVSAFNKAFSKNRLVVPREHVVEFLEGLFR